MSWLKESDFLHVDADLQKVKLDKKFYWVGMVKNGWAQYGHGAVKLTVSILNRSNRLIFGFQLQIQEI